MDKEVKFTDFVDLISPEYKTISNSRALTHLFLKVFILIILEAFLFFINTTIDSPVKYLFLAPTWFLTSLAFVSLFVIGHDCGHYQFHTNRKINNFVGHICMSFLLTGFHNWRLSHGFHHSHTNKAGMDPDWPFLMVTENEYNKLNIIDKITFYLGYKTPIGILSGFSVGMLKRTFMGTLLPMIPLSKKDKFDLIFSNILVLLVSGLVQYSIYSNFGGMDLIVYFWIPAALAMTWGTLLTFLHHSHSGVKIMDSNNYDRVMAQVDGTINVRFPRWIEFFICDINIHIPHHISMKIPWYHLKKVDNQVKKKYPQHHQEVPFSISLLTKFWKNPFLNEGTRSIN